MNVALQLRTSAGFNLNYQINLRCIKNTIHSLVGYKISRRFTTRFQHLNRSFRNLLRVWHTVAAVWTHQHFITALTGKVTHFCQSLKIFSSNLHHVDS